jgi:hypothetical protein
MQSFTPTKVKHSLTMERVTGSNTKKMGRLCFVDLFSKTGMRSNKPADFLGDKCDLDKSPNMTQQLHSLKYAPYMRLG